MNKATAVKYGSMLNVAKSAVQGIKDVNGKCKFASTSIFSVPVLLTIRVTFGMWSL